MKSRSNTGRERKPPSERVQPDQVCTGALQLDRCINYRGFLTVLRMHLLITGWTRYLYDTQQHHRERIVSRNCIFFFRACSCFCISFNIVYNVFLLFFLDPVDILFKEKKKKSIDPYMRSKIISLEEFIVTFFFFFFKSTYNNFYII